MRFIPVLLCWIARRYKIPIIKVLTRRIIFYFFFEMRLHFFFSFFCIKTRNLTGSISGSNKPDVFQMLVRLGFISAAEGKGKKIKVEAKKEISL